MALPALAITPSAAVQSYRAVDDSLSADAAGGGFGAALQRALGGVVDAGNAADRQSALAIAGTGNLTDVVTAVSKAELALQTTVAIRDRVVQAYQDIMRMPI